MLLRSPPAERPSERHFPHVLLCGRLPVSSTDRSFAYPTNIDRGAHKSTLSICNLESEHGTYAGTTIHVTDPSSDPDPDLDPGIAHCFTDYVVDNLAYGGTHAEPCSWRPPDSCANSSCVGLVDHNTLEHKPGVTTLHVCYHGCGH